MSDQHPAPEPARSAPLHIRVDRVVILGTALFAAWALLAWLVPALREGDRHWWPWVGVSGVALGLMAYGYLRRGLGNAAGVLRND